MLIVLYLFWPHSLLLLLIWRPFMSAFSSHLFLSTRKQTNLKYQLQPLFLSLHLSTFYTLNYHNIMVLTIHVSFQFNIVFIYLKVLISSNLMNLLFNFPHNTTNRSMFNWFNIDEPKRRKLRVGTNM